MMSHKTLYWFLLQLKYDFYRGKGSCKTLLPDLIKNGIDCDLRKLHVGDLLWVAREKVRPLPGKVRPLPGNNFPGNNFMVG